MCISQHPARADTACRTPAFSFTSRAAASVEKASDIAIQAQEIVRARQRIAELIAHETGQALDKVLKDIDRDYWMSADEAIDYGLVGRKISGRAEL